MNPRAIYSIGVSVVVAGLTVAAVYVIRSCPWYLSTGSISFVVTFISIYIKAGEKDDTARKN